MSKRCLYRPLVPIQYPLITAPCQFLELSLIGKTKFCLFLPLVTISAVNRNNHPASRPADPSTASSDPNLSVAAVHPDAEGVHVSLRERVDL